jgi:hypothetical protein
LYAWYEWIYFHDSAVPFPNDSEVLGRDLGPALDVGPAMSRKILKANDEIVIRSTTRALTPDKMNSDLEKQKRSEFDISIREKLGPAFVYDDEAEPLDVEYDTPVYEPYQDDEREAIVVPDIDDVHPVFHAVSG